MTNHALVNSQLSETLPDVMPSIVCVASLFPVVPQVIPRIPICRLEFLKIDAQGFDLAIAKSAGEWLTVANKVRSERTWHCGRATHPCMVLP